MPVFDFDLDDNGTAYLAMRRIEGQSLRDCIRLEIAGQTPDEVSTPDKKVQIFLKVCDALAYAHSKGIIHGDVKPDNIMIGAFGEALLIDWGTPAEEEGKLIGTPAYMSPEQARRVRMDERSDIYCLGATMFHALVLRHAAWAEDPDIFWQKKRQGTVDPPTFDERHRVPIPLLAITQRAIDPEPDKRYQSVQEISQDLHQYLTRGSVSVWGAPIVDQSFADPSWRERWIPVAANVAQTDDSITTSDGHQYMEMRFNRKIYDSVAIEVDAYIKEGAPLGDILLVWHEDRKRSADGTADISSPTTIRASATSWGEGFPAIAVGGDMLAGGDFAMTKGELYNLRLEIDGHIVSMYANGRLICSLDLPVPVTSGYVGFGGFYQGRHFCNARIYSKGVQEKVDAVATGDILFREKLYSEALEQYTKIARFHPQSEVGLLAIRGQGHCLYELGDKEKAYSTWAQLEGTALDHIAAHHNREQLFENGRHAELIDLVRAMDIEEDSRLDRTITSQWAHWCAAVVNTHGRGLAREAILEDYLSIREVLDNSRPLVQSWVSQLLFHMNRSEDILRDCPDIPGARAGALLRLNRAEEILDRYPDLRNACAEALSRQGRYEEIIADHADLMMKSVKALIDVGRPEEALKKYPGSRQQVLCAMGQAEQAFDEAPGPVPLLALGRYEEVLEDYADEPERCVQAQLHLRRYTDVLHSQHDHWLVSGALARYLVEFELALLDQPNTEAKSYAPPRHSRFDEALYKYLTLGHFLFMPLAKFLHGDTTDIAADWKIIDQEYRTYAAHIMWYLAEYALGHIDDSRFREQPKKQALDARLALARGMKADVNKQPEAAQAEYKAYASLPLWEREQNFVIDRFVDWRLGRLTPPDAVSCLERIK